MGKSETTFLIGVLMLMATFTLGVVIVTQESYELTKWMLTTFTMGIAFVILSVALNGGGDA